MWLISEHEGGDRRGIRPDAFESRFLEICEAHRAQGRALMFAFLLFGVRHPHVRNALENSAYWDALDELSGRTLTVFTFDIPHRSRRVAEPQGSYVIREMVALPWGPPDALSGALATYFPGISEKVLPCVLFFQVEDSQVIDKFAIGLGRHQVGAESAFNELNNILERATRSLAAVENENARNAREIFNLVREALKDRQLALKGLRLLQGARYMSPAVSLAKAIVSLF